MTSQHAAHLASQQFNGRSHMMGMMFRLEQLPVHACIAWTMQPTSAHARRAQIWMRELARHWLTGFFPDNMGHPACTSPASLHCPAQCTLMP